MFQSGAAFRGGEKKNMKYYSNTCDIQKERSLPQDLKLFLIKVNSAADSNGSGGQLRAVFLPH